jgi:hypothetical protein
MDIEQGKTFPFRVVAYDASDNLIALPAQPQVTVDANGTVTTQPTADGTGGVLTAGATPATPGGALTATSGGLTSPPFTFNVVVAAPEATRLAVEPASP